MNIADVNWDLVRTFLALLEHGSLSSAARALGSSQPTVGRQLDALEAALSSVLFVRSPQGLTPTLTSRAVWPLEVSPLSAATSAFAVTTTSRHSRRLRRALALALLVFPPRRRVG
jgi:DNA-binding transcriptional LysR family regulator